jgi:8-oxo-dGTP pyrophosphatase MutT (NUDIX family)
MKESSGILILNKHKKVLILRSSSGSFEIWSIPKGEIDKNESTLEAAVRETKEEAGISVNPDLLVYLGEKTYKTKKKKIHVYLFNAKQIEDIDPILNHENDKYLWASLEEAINLVHEAQVGFMSFVKELIND